MDGWVYIIYPYISSNRLYYTTHSNISIIGRNISWTLLFLRYFSRVGLEVLLYVFHVVGIGAGRNATRFETIVY